MSNTTMAAINSFKKTVTSHSSKTDSRVKQSQDKLAELCATAPPVTLNPSKLAEFFKIRAQRITALAEQCVFDRLTAKYPLISDDLFRMRRYLEISTDGKLITDLIEKTTKSDAKHKLLDVPLFITVPFSMAEESVEIHRATFTKLSGDRYYGYRTRKTVTITATLQPPPQEVSTAVTKAMADFYSVLSESYKNPTIAFMLRDSKKLQPKVESVWIPTADSLSLKVDTKVFKTPKKIDPAVLLVLGNNRFLIKLWNIEAEKPIEHYLREFSVGDAPISK